MFHLREMAKGGSGGSPPGKFLKIATQKTHFETVWYNNYVTTALMYWKQYKLHNDNISS